MDTQPLPAGGADAIVSVPVSTPAESDNTPIDIREAARQVSSWREKRDNPDAATDTKPADNAAPKEAAAQPDNSAQADGDPPQAAPAETTETAEPAQTEPPIEPPRSWTKEQKERWASLPRETQSYIADREQEREREFRRGQNEVAEQRKAIDAERQQATEARQRYEHALPALLQALQEQQAGEFSDIRTMADVEKLARDDWPRYALWDAQQKKIAAVAKEVSDAQDRQTREHEQQWHSYAAKQDELLLDRIPELADKDKSQRIADQSAALLRNTGFSDKEILANWTGKEKVSLRDARIAEIIVKAARYDGAKAETAAKPKPSVPPVQQPGTSKPRASAADDSIQALEKQFERTGSLKDAAALRLARVRAAAAS